MVEQLPYHSISKHHGTAVCGSAASPAMMLETMMVSDEDHCVLIYLSCKYDMCNA